MKLNVYSRFLICICAVLMNKAQASEEIESMRTITKEWVAVEQAISLEAVASVEKQTLLKDLVAATKAEIKTLQSALTEIEATRSAADVMREDLITDQEILRKNRTLILSFLLEMEPELKAFEKRLPTPLQEKLASFYQRLPENSSNTTLGIAERMQTVASLLTGIHEFDRTITVSDEIRTFANGTEGEVQSVYIGLGTAYYRTRSGDDAGIGHPNGEGWMWESQPGLNKEIAEVIAIVNQSTQKVRFIDLPVTLQN